MDSPKQRAIGAPELSIEFLLHRAIQRAQDGDQWIENRPSLGDLQEMLAALLNSQPDHGEPDIHEGDWVAIRSTGDIAQVVGIEHNSGEVYVDLGARGKWMIQGVDKAAAPRPHREPSEE